LRDTDRRLPGALRENDMASRYLTPAITFGQTSARVPAMDPFRLFHSGMDTLLADVARAASTDAGATSDLLPSPRINVENRESDLRITAELPGISENDVQITLEDDVLMIAGEKRQEREVDEGDLRVVERAFGRFRRAIQLPFAPDPEKVQARYRDGVLEIMVPKETEQRNRTRQIAVKRDERSLSDKRSSGRTSKASSRASSGAIAGASVGSSRANASKRREKVDTSAS
jgi:HSP20 family protein